MKDSFKGCILYDKINKCFVDGDGEQCDRMCKAYVYENKKFAEEDLKKFDEPNNYEIWDMKVLYKTIA